MHASSQLQFKTTALTKQWELEPKGYGDRDAQLLLQEISPGRGPGCGAFVELGSENSLSLDMLTASAFLCQPPSLATLCPQTGLRSGVGAIKWQPVGAHRTRGMPSCPNPLCIPEPQRHVFESHQLSYGQVRSSDCRARVRGFELMDNFLPIP